MKKSIFSSSHIFLIGLLWIGSCKVPSIVSKKENSSTPASFTSSIDTTNSGAIQWRNFFKDPYLIALIDTALVNNQELNVLKQEIEISKNEVMARKGEYLPFLRLGAGAAAVKAGKYTWDGIAEEDLKKNPDGSRKYIGEFMGGGLFSWELDVWKKLRNAKQAAAMRYMSSIEGRNFAVTNIIAEIVGSYYELLALDNMLIIINQNIELQKNVFQIVKQEKEAAKVTQLAVNRFEAQLLYTTNLQYEIKQSIVEAENRINFLVGRFPQRIQRNAASFDSQLKDPIFAGIPSQILANRPDIRQAELELAASKLDVISARANFYPSFSLSAGLGFQGYNPLYLINPVSIFYNLGGELMAPLINKNAIKATYLNANAKQIQAVYQYEQSILNAHIEVVNQLSKIENYQKSVQTKSNEVDILTRSIDISNDLYRSARADYMEVLLTQREALDSRIDLTEIQLKELLAKVNIYRALGGGWN